MNFLKFKNEFFLAEPGFAESLTYQLNILIYEQSLSFQGQLVKSNLIVKCIIETYQIYLF